MAMALPELNYDITSEILLRVPPDKPAHLSRASLVSKLWHRIISDPGFQRRYRAFHRRAPLLGFFYNLNFPRPFSAVGFDFPAPMSRFVATTAASPLPKAAAAHEDDHRRVSWALDCRHGRFLFKNADNRGLAVWDPIADDWTDLPPPGVLYLSYTGVVLCDVAGCDHSDCRGGRFLVVCIGCDVSATVYACVYSSEDSAWQAPVSDGTRCWSFDMMRPAHIGDGIYCIVGDPFSYSILRYDLVERSFARINMPTTYGGVSFFFDKRPPVLMQNEDGSLGVAGMRGSRLYLWSRRWNNSEGGAAGWVQRKVVKLRKLLPLDNKHCIKASVICFAEGVRVFFIRTHAGVFTLDLKSRRVMKVSNQSKNYPSVVPFISFFTPDCAS